LSTTILKSQLDSLLKDYKFNAIKIGMIPNLSFIKKIVNLLKKQKIPIVTDPVLRATVGKFLVEKEKYISAQNVLASASSLITPTIFEASILAGKKIKNTEDMKNFCVYFYNKSGCSVLLKGSEIAKTKIITNLLYHKEDFYEVRFQKLDTKNYHGTGCAFSTAVAFYLAKGKEMFEAIEESQKFISKIISNSQNFELKYGPIFY